MTVDTRYFGSIELDKSSIISFPEGLPGFRDAMEFVIISNEDGNNPFHWLQCVDKPELTFVIIDPKYIDPEYIIDIEDSEVTILKLTDISKIIVLAIVVIPENIDDMTANLRAPVIINTEKKIGKQVVMEKGEYKIRHYILNSPNRSGGI